MIPQYQTKCDSGPPGGRSEALVNGHHDDAVGLVLARVKGWVESGLLDLAFVLTGQHPGGRVVNDCMAWLWLASAGEEQHVLAGACNRRLAAVAALLV
jgi:hypothetical protein